MEVAQEGQEEGVVPLFSKKAKMETRIMVLNFEVAEAEEVAAEAEAEMLMN